MNGDVSFDGLLAVMALAVSIPLLLGLFPRLPVPSSVVEILAGILVGPAVLAWVHEGDAINVIAKLGVAFLLFLAGLELDFDKLRGKPLVFGLSTFGASLAIGLGLTIPLWELGVIVNPLLIAIILSATSLGIVCPVLKDSGQLDTHLGRFVVAACSVAEFGSIVLLSLFFSRSGGPDPAQTAGKLVVLFLSVAVIAVVAARGEWARVNKVLFRLQDTSSQLRVRLSILLLLALLVLSEELKFDAILGAFMAGALISALTDRTRDDDYGNIRVKLDGIGFGIFVPVFFVATGLAFPVDALFSDASTALRVPLFLGLLLVVRGIPALLLRNEVTAPEKLAAGLLQATSLSFIVVGTQIGVELGELKPVNAASLVAAGMLSVLLFPASALAVLSGPARLLSRGRNGDGARAPGRLRDVVADEMAGSAPEFLVDDDLGPVSDP